MSHGYEEEVGSLSRMKGGRKWTGRGGLHEEQNSGDFVRFLLLPGHGVFTTRPLQMKLIVFITCHL